MRAIFAIGNPGRRYANTRHNAGFIAADHFAGLKALSFRRHGDEYLYATGLTDQARFAIVKPLTYVNLCGIAARSFIERNPLGLSDFLVISDDINLQTGILRIRKSGGDGGHNGVKSLIYHLESDRFPRLRIGVGNISDEGELADYVLGNFTYDELEKMDSVLPFSSNLLSIFVNSGIQPMLDYFSKFGSSIASNIQNIEGNQE